MHLLNCTTLNCSDSRATQVEREHYLRDDIWCGYSGCRVCKHSNPVLVGGHALMPDTNVILHQVSLITRSYNQY